MAKREKERPAAPLWRRLVRAAPRLLLLAVLLAGFAVEQAGGWARLYGRFGLSLGGPAPEQLQGGGASVTVLDVGQGDAVLLAQGGHTALLDAGTPESAGDLLLMLEQAGVERLDLVILTHPHSDHGGGMAAVLEAVPVEQLVLPPTDGKEPALQARIRRAATEAGVPVAMAETGQSWPLGRGSVTVLQAGFTDPEAAPEDGNTIQNNASLCLRFAAGDFAFLDTGDAEAAAEQALVDTYGGTLHAALLKAGHHGSSTSNSEALLRAASPQWVAISCGAGNDYGHPHQAVLDRLNGLGIQTARTDTQGTLTFLWQDGALTCLTGADTAPAARPAA